MPSSHTRGFRALISTRVRGVVCVATIAMLPLSAVAAGAQPVRSSASVRLQSTPSVGKPNPRGMPEPMHLQPHDARAPMAQDRNPPPMSVRRHVLIGSIIGAGVATAYVFIQTHRTNVTDHSYDSAYYYVLVPAGALAGAVVGGIVGIGRNGASRQ